MAYTFLLHTLAYLLYILYYFLIVYFIVLLTASWDTWNCLILYFIRYCWTASDWIHYSRKELALWLRSSSRGKQQIGLFYYALMAFPYSCGQVHQCYFPWSYLPVVNSYLQIEFTPYSKGRAISSQPRSRIWNCANTFLPIQPTIECINDGTYPRYSIGFKLDLVSRVSRLPSIRSISWG